MHNISFNGFDLNACIMCTELHLQSDLFFNLQFIFHIYIRNNIASFSDYFAGLCYVNLLPRTTFVREEASRDEALRTTERRASLRTLTFILQRVFFTLGARRHLRRCPEFLKQKKHFFEKLMSRRTTVFCISLIT